MCTNIGAVGVPEQAGKVGQRKKRYRENYLKKKKIEKLKNFVQAINPRNLTNPQPNKQEKIYTQGHHKQID